MAGTKPLKPETVGALLETTRHLLGDEDRRGESLNARGAGLAGFAGVIASLAGALGTNALSASLGKARWVAVPALVGGLAALVAAIAIAVFGVLFPRTFDTIATEEIERYPNYEYVTIDRVMVDGTVLRGLVGILATQRQRNAEKATRLKAAYVALMVGVALIGIAAATVALTKTGNW